MSNAPPTPPRAAPQQVKPQPALAPAPQAASPPDGAVEAPGAPALPEGWVNYRVLKLGAGEGKPERNPGFISTGEHIAGFGDVYHKAGDIVAAPLEVAQALEDRGYVEIQ